MPAFGSFAGFGVSPTLLSAENDGPRTIYLQFSEWMLNNADLVDVGSYTLTPQGASVARTILVASAQPDDPSRVVLTVNGDLTPGTAAYDIDVDDLVDQAGNIIGTPDNVLFDVSPDAGPIPDHEALAIRRLIAQYRGQPNIESVIRLMGRRAIGVDQEATNIGAFRGLETSYGIGLDRIGQLLDFPRDGLSDAVYKIRLRATVLAHASHGRPDEVIAVLVTLLDGGPAPDHEQHFPAAIVMETDGIPNADGWAFAPIVRRAVPAGVQFQLLHDVGGVLFGWDEDAAAGTWGEIDDDPAAGTWAEAS